MDLKKYLISDSKKCFLFINKIKRDSYFKPSTQLINFALNFLNTYNQIYQRVDIKTEGFIVKQHLSKFPHFINFLKSYNQPNSYSLIINNLNDQPSIEDISRVSELISNKNNDNLNFIYDIAIKSHPYLLYHSEIYQGFCPLIVQFEIEQKLSHLIKHYYTYDNCRVIIEGFTNSHSIKLDYIKDIISRLLTINQLSKVNINRIRCKFWLTKQNKSLPQEKVLTSHSVNTASTYCHNCDYVKVWRIEESKKVICHEIFHCLGLDFHDFSEDLLNVLKSKLNIPDTTNILLFEAYVETWATIINCICYVNLFRSQNQQVLSNFLKIIIEYEICFSNFQTAKILHFFGFKTYQEFFNINGFSKDKLSNQFQQTSCSLSYYILKSALLYNVNEFIIYCLHHNKPTIFNFNETNKSCQDYLSLIIKSLDKLEYKQDINTNLSLLQEKKIQDLFILNNLRMTCIEYY